VTERLIEQTTPWSAISRWNSLLEYWLPRSERAAAKPARHVAIRSAGDSCAVIATLYYLAAREQTDDGLPLT
jgi:hypothetical protein